LPATWDGAHETGGEVDLFSPDAVGLLVHSVAAGALRFGLQSTFYGLYTVYLVVPSSIYYTQKAVISLPYAYKVVAAAANDCLPILGYQRKPYMALGWVITSLAMLFSSMAPLPEPYWCQAADGSYITTRDNNVTGIINITDANGTVTSAEEVLGVVSVPAEPCDPHASYAGTFYTMMTGMAMVGLLLSDTAANGLVVRYARREGLRTRGRAFALCSGLRDGLGATLGAALVAFLMNGPEYEGSFASGLPYTSICAVFAVVAAVMVPVVLWAVYEPGGGTARRTSQPLAITYDLLCGKPVLLLVFYCMWSASLQNASTPANTFVADYWADVSNFQMVVASMLQDIGVLAGFALVLRSLLHVNWRLLVFVPILFIVTIKCVVGVLVSYDAVRNQYFFLSEPVLEGLPNGIQEAALGFAAFELASAQNEGLTFAIFSGSLSAGTPVGRMLADFLYKPISDGALSDVNNYITDDTAFRQTVANSYLITFGLGLASLVPLCFLPTGKAQAQQAARSQARSRRYALLAIGLWFIPTLAATVWDIAYIHSNPPAPETHSKYAADRSARASRERFINMTDPHLDYGRLDHGATLGHLQHEIMDRSARSWSTLNIPGGGLAPE